MEINTRAIERFRQLARAGKHAGASSGEKTAHRLAVALHNIGDDLAVLDSTVLLGALDLMRCMSGPWPTDASKEAVFRCVASAAGKS